MDSLNHDNQADIIEAFNSTSHLGFWSGNLFLITPFPDLCLLLFIFVFQPSY